MKHWMRDPIAEIKFWKIWKTYTNILSVTASTDLNLIHMHFQSAIEVTDLWEGCKFWGKLVRSVKLEQFIRLRTEKCFGDEDQD